MDCGGLQFGDLIEIEVVGIQSDNLCHPYETIIVGYVDRQEWFGNGLTVAVDTKVQRGFTARNRELI